jgi:hypothetical protein
VARKIVNFVISKKLAVRALAGFVAKTKQPVLAETIIAFSAVTLKLAPKVRAIFRVQIMQPVAEEIITPVNIVLAKTKLRNYAAKQFAE